LDGYDLTIGGYCILFRIIVSLALFCCCC